MLIRRRRRPLAACATAAMMTAALASTIARAQDKPSNADQELGIILGRPLDSNAAAAPGNQPAARRPLMSMFDQLGVGSALDNARIDIYGHAEGSYTRSDRNPDSGLIVGRVFDFEDDQATLNQIDVVTERRVDLDAQQFDMGFRVEWLYGGDSRFIHSNGLLDNYDFFDGPENQFDLVQAYADLAIPMGGDHSLRIRMGKFLFFKQIDPNASVFYSHSFTFGAALPFTLTGATTYYEFNDNWSIEGGLVRGWDDSLEDDNASVSGVARVRARVGDQLNLSLAAISGPEQVDNNGDYRTAVNFVASYTVSSQFTLLLDSVYGYESDNPGSGASDWYGAAVYGIYKINDYVSAAARVEYYRDDEGFTTGIATAGPTLGFSSQDLFEVTAGLTITPFAGNELGRNFKLRPEVRYDMSSEDYFDDFREDSQITFAVDAIFNF